MAALLIQPDNKIIEKNCNKTKTAQSIIFKTTFSNFANHYINN